MYEYLATVIRVVDGDTVDCRIDLGWNVFVEGKVRLLGINAPEMRTPEGPISKAFLERLMPVGNIFLLRSVKDRKEKYGRYLGVFYKVGPDQSVNDEMVASGMAVRYKID